MRRVLQAAAEEDAAVGAGEAQSAERGGKKPPCGKPCNHVDNPYGAPAVDVDEEDTAQPDKLASAPPPSPGCAAAVRISSECLRVCMHACAESAHCPPQRRRTSTRW